jgi:hypothetical protein
MVNHVRRSNTKSAERTQTVLQRPTNKISFVDLSNENVERWGGKKCTLQTISWNVRNRTDRNIEVLEHTTASGTKNTDGQTFVDEKPELVLLLQLNQLRQRAEIARVHVDCFNDEELPSDCSFLRILNDT